MAMRGARRRATMRCGRLPHRLVERRDATRLASVCAYLRKVASAQPLLLNEGH
jgi:hypothetical protein